MSPRPASQPGSSLFSALSTVTLLVAATALLGGGLFIAADAIASRPQPEATPQAKIGSAYEAKRSGPVVVAPAEPSPGPAARPVLAVEPMTATPAPERNQPPAEPVVTPVVTPPVTPAAPASADPAGARPAPGSAGCTRYRTYDATTQTYRAFDGTIRRCQSADRRT